MAFKRNKRRKGLEEVADNNIVIDNITPISIENMTISFNGNKALFFRLNKKCCPPYWSGNGVTKEFAEAEDMKREEFVLEMYELFKTFSVKTQSPYNHFMALCLYVGKLDTNGKEISFCEENIKWFFDVLSNEYLKGELSKSSIAKHRVGIVAILKAMGKEEIARNIPQVKGTHREIKPYKTLSDKELKIIGRKIMVAYKRFCHIYLSGSEPDICPFFDEEELKEFNFNSQEIEEIRDFCYRRVRVRPWCFTNHMTSVALMITSLWTGANLTALTTLRRKDVTMKSNDGGRHFEFSSTKARAMYQKNKLGIGFKKPTKRFVESWLQVSEKLSPSDDSPLFPFFSEEGELQTNGKGSHARRPQEYTNGYLKRVGLSTISTSIFRKTRSNVLKRAFNDNFVVADANKSSVETVTSHYLHGVEEDNMRQIAGALEAQKNIADGSSKDDAIKKALYKFQDPLTLVEWNDYLPNKTPTGMRCKEPFGEKAKRSIGKIKKRITVVDDGACVDFLDCFGCVHHALICEKDDIWLMLSFRDSIIEAIARPSYNSTPSEKFNKILNTVNQILERYEEKDKSEYDKAYELNKYEAHPLWNDADSVEDMLGVYPSNKGSNNDK